jgi:excisionase family DNA binding protein
MEDFYTTKEAAEELGVTDAYIRQMILNGKLGALKAGRDHLIPAAEIKKARGRRTTRGPEPKPKTEEPAAAPKKTSRQKRGVAK